MSDNGLTLEERATNYETFRHIERVRNLIQDFVKMLLDRAAQHDQSKLAPPEVGAFTELTPKLATSTYGSPEYEQFRKELGPALAHHYSKNRHHPEHYPEGVEERLRQDIEWLAGLEPFNEYGAQGTASKMRLLAHLQRYLKSLESRVNHMTLVDVLELFVDWRAASERHHDGNILTSIAKNTDRFGLSTQLAQILENTAELIDNGGGV